MSRRLVLLSMVALTGCAPMDVDEHPPWPPEDGGRAGDMAEQAGCPAGEGETLDPPHIADWVAYVSDHEGATAIADRLGGELRPNDVAGPPDGIVNQLCPL